MRTSLCALGALLAFLMSQAHAQTPVANPDADKEDWIVLFNGKDLTGWTPKIAKHEYGDNYANTFRVENGLLEVRYDKNKYKTFDEQFGHLFYKDPFSYYRLVVEYRFVGQQVPGGPNWALRNSGAMLHSPDPRSMPRDQTFPISVEGQLLGGNSDGSFAILDLGTQMGAPGSPFLKNATAPLARFACTELAGGPVAAVSLASAN